MNYSSIVFNLFSTAIPSPSNPVELFQVCVCVRACVFVFHIHRTTVGVVVVEAVGLWEEGSVREMVFDIVSNESGNSDNLTKYCFCPWNSPSINDDYFGKLNKI